MKTEHRIRFFVLILLLEAALFLVFWSVKLPREVIKPLPLIPKRKIEALDPSIVVDKFSFRDQDSLKGWDEKVFRGKTSYKVASDRTGSYLSSSSDKTSSALYKKINRKLSPDFHMSWRWRANLFPVKKGAENLSNRAQDDFTARFYLVFPGTTFFNTRIIEYIWDEKLPVGSTASSPFSQNVKLLVVRSGKGPQENGGWQDDERNIYEDYKNLFGKDPDRPLGAIGLMSDSDNTASSSASDFSSIVLKIKKKPETVPVSQDGSAPS